MPDRVKFGVVCFGLSGLMLVVFSIASIFAASESGLTNLGGILGVAELVVVGRVVEGRQWARLIAMSLCLAQALYGVAGLIGDVLVAIPAIVVAGLVIVPLSGREADEFFGAAA